jgi:type I restriction enzyme, S subunit
MTPDGWREVRLDQIARIVGGGTPSRDNGAFWDGNIPWATPTDITKLRGRYITSTGSRISQAGLKASAAALLPPGSLLMTSRATIGVCAINEVPMATNQGFQNLVPTDAAITQYLGYLISYRAKDLLKLAAGSTFLEISRRSVAGFPIVLPPPGEQRKIAAILSSVDDAIEATRAVIDQLQLVKEAMMAELLTLGLPGLHNRFKKTEIGEVPEEWAVVQMEALSAPKGMVGGPFGSDLTAKDYVPKPGVPVIRGGNVSMGRFSEEEFVFVSREKAVDLAKNAARPGDLVMTQRGASLGEVTFLPADSGYDFYIISQTMMRMTPDSSKISPRFLLHYTCSALAQQWLQGHQIATGQPHLNLGIYREMPAVVPARQEQEAIATAMDRLDEAKDSNVQQLEQLKCLKGALMSVLLTGEVRVTPDKAAA